MDELDQFIEAHCYKYSSARLKFLDFRLRFEATLTATQLDYWRRDTLKHTLARRFLVGPDYNTRTLYIAGLSFLPEPTWTLTEDGRLKLVARTSENAQCQK